MENTPDKNTKHGTKVACWSCSAPGTFDDLKRGTPDALNVFEDSVFLVKWEAGDPEELRDDPVSQCMDCWLK